MSNRVEELELKVSDLQAAVNGLTEELVETKERVRQLEQQVDVDDPVTTRRSKETNSTAEPAAADESTADTAPEDDTEDTEDIEEPGDDSAFVDAEERRREREADEEAKSEEANEDEKDAESEQDDIIVA